MDSNRTSSSNLFESINRLISSLENSGIENIEEYSPALVGTFKREVDALWNNPAYGALLTDLHGSILRVNKSFLQFSGYEETEVLDSSWHDFGISVERKELEDKVGKLIDTKEEFVQFHFSFLTKSTRVIPTDYFVTTVFDDDGEPENLLHIIIPRDNFSRSEPILKYQKDFLHTLLNSIPNPVYYKNNKGIFLGCNKKFEELFNEKVDEIFGKSEYEVFPGEIAAKEYNTDLEVVNSKNKISYFATYVKDGNQAIELEINKTVFFDKSGNVAGIIGIINDVTQQKEFEITLIESKEKLKESNKNRDKLFSIISHNLRSPFTTILGFADILVDEYDSYSDEDKKSFALEIQKSARFAYSLLNNLLLWTKSQIGNLQPKEEFLDLTLFVDEVIHRLKQKAGKKNITLENRIPEHFNVFADKTLLTNILENILDNAIKFSYDKSRVVISADKSDDHILLQVKDSGVGISEEKLSRLINFEEHVTSYGTGKEKGTGLGLVICKELLGKMNGELEIESQEDVGTTVTIKLPKTVKSG